MMHTALLCVVGHVKPHPKMKYEKIRNKGQGTLFSNPAVEILTKTKPIVIYSMYLPVIFFLIYYGSVYLTLPVGSLLLWFFGGLLLWTLFEYLIHRYLFHMMVETERGRRIVYTLHGVHHEYPRDQERLFMPPLPSLLIAIVIFFIMYLAVGIHVAALFPGFLLGYLIYGSMHYAIHAFPPPKLLKSLWRNHHLHHYKTPNKGFGVSSVLWDVVFGTMTRKEEA